LRGLKIGYLGEERVWGNSFWAGIKAENQKVDLMNKV
jgi:hypothetical protein